VVGVVGVVVVRVMGVVALGAVRGVRADAGRRWGDLAEVLEREGLGAALGDSLAAVVRGR
jgi:hypothetical protein